MRSPSNSIASSVRNSGAVKLIAVKSASGIIVNAVNQQNMLAVPAKDRTACERSLSVRKIWKPWKCHAMNASTAIEITPRTKMIWPVGTPEPKYLTQAARHESSTTDDSFRNTPRTGRCCCSFAAKARTSRDLTGAHHSRPYGAFKIRLFLPRGRTHADHLAHVVDHFAVELRGMEPGSERGSAVHAALRRVPLESHRGRRADARRDGRGRPERDRGVADGRHDAPSGSGAHGGRAHRDRRARHGPPRARSDGAARPRPVH